MTTRLAPTIRTSICDTACCSRPGTRTSTRWRTNFAPRATGLRKGLRRCQEEGKPGLGKRSRAHPPARQAPSARAQPGGRDKPPPGVRVASQRRQRPRRPGKLPGADPLRFTARSVRRPRGARRSAVAGLERGARLHRRPADCPTAAGPLPPLRRGPGRLTVATDSGGASEPRPAPHVSALGRKISSFLPSSQARWLM